jgi:hypothetical protein
MFIVCGEQRRSIASGKRRAIAGLRELAPKRLMDHRSEYYDNTDPIRKPA